MHLYLYSLQAGPSKTTSNSDHQNQCDRAESDRAGWLALLGSQTTGKKRVCIIIDHSIFDASILEMEAASIFDQFSSTRSQFSEKKSCCRIL